MKIRNVIRAALLICLCGLTLTACSGESASDYYKKGLKNLKAGEYDLAVENLNKATELNPDKAEYYIDYGFSLIQGGRYAEAQIPFDKAISEKENQIVLENNKRALRGKGIAYLYSNDYDKAVDVFEKAAKIPELPDMNTDILRYLGDAQMKAADYAGAVATFSKLVEIKKSDAASFGRRADAYSAMGKTKEAEQDYDTAIVMDGSNFSFYFGKYNLQTANGDEAGAKATLSAALAIKTAKDDDSGYFNLAVLHYLSGSYDMAASEMSNAVGKGFTEANYYLGRIYEEQKDLENAVYYYKQYIDNTPYINSAAVYYSLSACYLAGEQYAESLEMIEKGVALNDSAYSRKLLYVQVAVYEKLGNFEEAKKAAQTYADKYPSDEAMQRELVFLEGRTKKKKK